VRLQLTKAKSPTASFAPASGRNAIFSHRLSLLTNPQTHKPTNWQTHKLEPISKIGIVIVSAPTVNLPPPPNSLFERLLELAQLTNPSPHFSALNPCPLPFFKKPTNSSAFRVEPSNEWIFWPSGLSSTYSGSVTTPVSVCSRPLLKSSAAVSRS